MSGSPLTACGWIKCKTHASTMANGVAFGTATETTGPQNTGWGICVTWPALTLQYMEGNATTLTLGASLLPDTWYFVCVTNDGTNLRLYVNAVEVDTTPTPTLSGGTTFKIGWGIRGGGVRQWRPFYGMVDEVAVWQQALTAAQIATVYAARVESFGQGDIPISDGNGGVTWGQLPASSVGFTPAGTIAATDVQAAIEEVAGESGALVWEDV